MDEYDQFRRQLSGVIPKLLEKPELLQGLNPLALIKTYRALRDDKKDIEDATAQKLAPIKQLMEKVEGNLLERFAQAGVTSFSTEVGSATKVVKRYVRVSDWQAFVEWAREDEENRLRLLKRDVAKAEILAYMDQFGEAPPGVTLTQELGINVRKSR